LEELVDSSSPGPSGIVYLPYLSGSASPWPDGQVRGAFIGLEKGHSRGDLVKAVLEGTSYEMEAIRQSAQRIAGRAINRVVAVGGGTKNTQWIQAKADISNCEYALPPVAESTLLGAALVAGLGAGLIHLEQIQGLVAKQKAKSILVTPDFNRHEEYNDFYQRAYLAIQAPIRQYFHQLNKGQ